MVREDRMRWPRFIQNFVESTLKRPFLAVKLQIRSGDTSSVDFVDSDREKMARESRMRWPHFSQNST